MKVAQLIEMLENWHPDQEVELIDQYGDSYQIADVAPLMRRNYNDKQERNSIGLKFDNDIK